MKRIALSGNSGYAVDDEIAETGKRRIRNARIASGANLIAKVVTILTSFGTVPLTLKYLGEERFGLWMTISSLTALLAFADFGLGNGLMNAVSSAFGRSDRIAMRRVITNALIMLTAVACACVIFFLPIIFLPWMKWDLLFGIKDPLAIRETPIALAIFILCFALSMLAGVIQRTQMALQMGFLNAISSGLGAVLGLAGVIVVIHFNGGLPWLVAALLGGPLISTALSGAWFFLQSQPDLFPKRKDISNSEMKGLFSIGGLFFLLQLAGALSYGSDNVIGAHFVGAQAVGEYAIASKLFNGVSLVVAIVLTSLWPAYAEAISRGDIPWVRKTLRRSIIQIGFFSLISSIVIIVSFDFVMTVWIRKSISASPWLLVGLAAWTVIGGIGNAIAIFLNGAHVLKEQLVIALTFAIASIFLKVVFIRTFGMTTIPWVTVLLYITTTLIPFSIMIPKIIRQLGEKAQVPKDRS